MKKVEKMSKKKFHFFSTKIEDKIKKLKKYKKSDDALRVTRAVTRLTVYHPHQVIRWQSTGTSASSRNYSCVLSSFFEKIEFFCINIYFLDFDAVSNVITRDHAEWRPPL